MGTKMAEITKNGELKIKGNINTRLPAVVDGLVAHFPFDGKGGAFDCIGGNQTVQNVENDVNLVEAMEKDWRNPSSWSNSTNMNWDNKLQALKITGSHNTWLKTPIIVDSNKTYEIEMEVMVEYQDGTSGFYLGGESENENHERVTPNYDYTLAVSEKPILGEWKTYKLWRTGINSFSYVYGEIEGTCGWTGTRSKLSPLLTKYYYMGGLFNYSSSAIAVMYVRKMSIKIIDSDISNCTITKDGIAVEEATTNIFPRSANVGAFTSGYNGTGYGFGSNSNIQQEIDNSLRQTSKTAVTKISRIIGNTSQRDYVSISLSSTINTTRILSFWYFGTYGNNIQPYNNDGCASLYYINDDGVWIGGGTSINIPVPIRQWKKIYLKIENKGVKSGTGFSWFIMHIDSATATLSTNEFWAFNEFQYEEKDFPTSFTEGSRNHGELKIPINLPKDFSLVSTIYNRINNEICNHVITKNGNSFKYYKDGIETTEYKDRQREQRGYLDNKYPTFDNGSNPFLHGFFECTQASLDGEWDYQSWIDSLWGGYFKCFIFCIKDVSISIPVRGDNKAYWRLNYDDSSIFSRGCTFVTNTFCFKKGWNTIECVWSDGDSGGGVFGDIAKSINSNTNAIYITSNLPIDMVGNYIWYNRYSSSVYKDLSIYDRALTDNEIKELSSSKFNLQTNGDLITNQIISKPTLPDDVYYFPLGFNCNDEFNCTEPTIENNIVHEDGSVWIGKLTKNEYSYPTFETTSSSGGWNHWGRAGSIGSAGQNIDKKYIYGNQKYSHWVNNTSEATGEYLVYQSPACEETDRSLQCICCSEDECEINDNVLFPVWNAPKGGTPNSHWTSIERIGDSIFYLCKCEGVHQDGTNDLIGCYVKPGYKIYISSMCLENQAFSSPYTENTRENSELTYDFNGIISENNDWTVGIFAKPNLFNMQGHSSGVGRTSPISIGNYYGVDESDLSWLHNWSSSDGYGQFRISNYHNKVSNIVSSISLNEEECSNWVFIVTKYVSSENKVYAYICTNNSIHKISNTVNLDGIKPVIYVGGYAWAKNCWDGYLRDLMVAKRSLTDEEISDIYNKKLIINTDNTLQIQNSITTEEI